MDANRDSVVDYAAVGHERATALAGRGQPPGTRSYVALAVLLVGLVAALLVLALLLRSGGTAS